MRVFFHVVGRDNAALDFPKTVHSRKPIRFVEEALSEQVGGQMAEQLRTIFPSGTYNCWGVPEGANLVIRSLQPGDAVLLVETIGAGGRVPALAEVKYYWHRPLPALSEALWGDNRFPFIFFFDTEPLRLTWEDLRKELGFNIRYRPPPHFHSVRSERLAEMGGPQTFVDRIRRHYSVEPPPYGAQRSVARKVVSEPPGDYSHSVEQEGEEILRVSRAPAPQLTSAQGRVSQTKLASPRSAAFRARVLELYDFRCAVCGCSLYTPQGLAEAEAAHIYPKHLDGSDDLRNGLCLCRRHHWAFDAGWFTLTDDLRVWVRPGLPEADDFRFIRDYDGASIVRAATPELAPHPLFLAAHRRLHGFA